MSMQSSHPPPPPDFLEEYGICITHPHSVRLVMSMLRPVWCAVVMTGRAYRAFGRAGGMRGLLRVRSPVGFDRAPRSAVSPGRKNSMAR